MKYQVIIQPPAQLDIESIYLYLRDRSPMGAKKWLTGIERAIESLERLPGRFGLARENAEFPAEEIRQLIYGRRSGRYRVLYTIRQDKVHILHVRHGARESLSPDELES